MPAITSTNVAQAIVKLVASEALPAVVGNLVLGNLVNRNYEPVISQAGDTVNVPIAPQLTANNIAESGTVTTQNPSLGNAQIVLNTHAEASFQIPDVTRVLAVPDLLATYMRPAVIAIAERVEKDLANLAVYFTANTAIGTGGSASLTEANVDSAETALVKQKVPMGDPLFLVLNPDAYSTVRQIARFSEYRIREEAGTAAINRGVLGQIKNFQVIRSQYVYTSGSNVYNFAFHRDALGLVIRRLPQPIPGTGAVAQYTEMGNFGLRVVMSYAPNSLAQQFTIDGLYGVGVLRNVFGQQILY